MALVVHGVVTVSELERMTTNQTRKLYFRWLTAKSRGLV